MWALCLILTLTGYLPEGHPARTDVKLSIINDAPWFRFPYPGKSKYKDLKRQFHYNLAVFAFRSMGYSNCNTCRSFRNVGWCSCLYC